jgi:hypothetical protein
LRQIGGDEGVPAYLLELRKPDRTTTGRRGLNDMGDDSKSVLVQKRTILGCIQASMVKRFALKRSDCFPVYSAAGEHQGRLGCGMHPENVEHRVLIFGGQVEKAVPCQNAVKAPAEGQRPHILDNPVLIGKSRFAEVDERWRRIHARHMASLFDEVPGNGFGGTASNVEDGSSRLQKGQEAVEPRLFKKVAPSFAIKTAGVPLVDAYDSFRRGVHIETLT